MNNSRYRLIQARKLRAKDRGGWDLKNAQSRRVARLVERILGRIAKRTKPASRRKSEPLWSKLKRWG